MHRLTRRLPSPPNLAGPGAVEFEVDTPEQKLLEGIACHCSSCKTVSSGASFNIQVRPSYTRPRDRAVRPACYYTADPADAPLLSPHPHSYSHPGTHLHPASASAPARPPAARVWYAQGETDAIRITKGERAFRTYVDTGRSGKPMKRNFCGECGSALYSAPDSMPGVAFIKVRTRSCVRMRCRGECTRLTFCMFGFARLRFPLGSLAVQVGPLDISEKVKLGAEIFCENAHPTTLHQADTVTRLDAKMEPFKG